MKELSRMNVQLPATLPELSKFVLVGREKLTAVRAEIRAIDKLDLAKEVREQKKQEAQFLGEALLDAEARIGEMLMEIPKDKSFKGNQHIRQIDTGVVSPKPKKDVLKDLGINEKQAERFEILAEHKEIIEQVKAEARENEDIPTRTAVLNNVKEIKKIEAFKNKTIERDAQASDIKLKNFVNGDSITELEKLQDKSVDCVITDPPYGIDYISNYRTSNDNVAREIKNDGLEEALFLWEKTCEILDKKVKDDCHLYIFTSWKVWHYFRFITEKYFKIKNCLIWEKNNWSMGDLSGNYAEQYEMILFATRGNRELIGKRDTNILKFDRVSNHALMHSCEKPIDLLKYLISKSTIENELIVDPFAGSGSTLLAAKETNRNFWGCEIDQEHYIKALGRFA